MEWAEHLCRLCAKTDVYCVKVFSKEGDEILLRHKMKVCSPITVKRTDLLPQQVCLHCLNDLDNNYDFYQKCKQTQFLLHQKLYDESKMESKKNNLPQKRPLVVEAGNEQVLEPSEKKSMVKIKESSTPKKVGDQIKSPPLYAIVSSGGTESSTKVLDNPSSQTLPTASASTPSRNPETNSSFERASIIKTNQNAAQQRTKKPQECGKNPETKNTGGLCTIAAPNKTPEMSANEKSAISLGTCVEPEDTTGTELLSSSSKKVMACRNQEIQDTSEKSASIETTKNVGSAGTTKNGNSNIKSPTEGIAGKPVTSNSSNGTPPSLLVPIKASPSSSPMAPSPSQMLSPPSSLTPIKEAIVPRIKTNSDLVYVRCRWCEKEVRQEFIFQHELLHAGDKVNSCLICDKNFVTVQAMESHRCTTK